MAKEYQRLQFISDHAGIRGGLEIVDENRGVRERSLIFDEAKIVAVDIPIGDKVDLVDVDTENSSVNLKVVSEDKMPEVCIVDDKTGIAWCNYNIFKSGKDPEEIKTMVNSLSNAIDILEHAHPTMKDTLEHIVTRFNITDTVETQDGDEIPAYTTYPSDAPVCEITISSKWLKTNDVVTLTRILSHELGHCQEAYHRRIRYLQPRNGGWIRKNGKVIPRGEERVAEHFSHRIMKNLWYRVP